MRREIVLLKVEDKAERQNRSGGRKRQSSDASPRLCPIRRREEEKTQRQERRDGELKNMHDSSFVRVGRRNVPGDHRTHCERKHRHQRCERHHIQPYRANLVELLSTHRITSFHEDIERPNPTEALNRY